MFWLKCLMSVAHGYSRSLPPEAGWPPFHELQGGQDSTGCPGGETGIGSPHPILPRPGVQGPGPWWTCQCSERNQVRTEPGRPGLRGRKPGQGTPGSWCCHRELLWESSMRSGHRGLQGAMLPVSSGQVTGAGALTCGCWARLCPGSANTAVPRGPLCPPAPAQQLPPGFVPWRAGRRGEATAGAPGAGLRGSTKGGGKARPASLPQFPSSAPCPSKD